ncbi:MAG: L-arabinose isomerase [Clostridia bacterium]
MLKKYVFWFVTGSQHLYGEEVLKQVAKDAQEIANECNRALPCEVVWKPTVKSPDEITSLCLAANNDPTCCGVITWMHTFSPSKMWINGLKILHKPMLHLHTQYNRDIPWETIDMDFMNLNQAAHGDREHGFIGTRLRLNRKVVSGYWKEKETQRRIEVWMRAAIGAFESKTLKIARLGDNMREVAVTEGDKVEAQIQFGWAINGYGIGEFVKLVDAVTTEELDALLAKYSDLFDMKSEKIEHIKVQAKYEIAMKKFMENGGFGAFTTTFEDLHGLTQLPGLSSQRLMQAGFGFGPEGDWKTAALVRIFKLMSQDQAGGTTLMEDYTYHLEPGREAILGSHMLEICPSIADGKPKLEVHPLGIGGKDDPARLVFDGKAGRAICVTMIDMGNRFRMIVSEVEAMKPYEDMPNLPVARVMWKPLPDFVTATEAWIYAGGAHHTAMTYDLTTEHMRDFAEMMDLELVVIDKDTKIDAFKKELMYNDLIWKLK